MRSRPRPTWPRADPGQKRVLGEWIARLGLDLGWPVTEGWAKAPDGRFGPCRDVERRAHQNRRGVEVVGTARAFAHPTKMPSSLAGRGLAERGLRGGEARDRH